MAQIYHNITELIGNTPIVKLNKLVPEGAADVYVKLEAFNPGSSVKDRIALSMIETAEQEGLIQPSATIVEATSGNTGIGLSWVGAAKGYKVVIVMPETMSVERRKIIQAYGAELVLTPGSEGMKGAIAKAEEIAKERNGWLPLQFNNPANPEVHERTTGAEIISAFGEKGLDAFVGGVGTGGTISGVSHALKKVNPNIQVYAVEADESAILSGENPGPHKIQGIGAGFVPDTLNTKVYDEIIKVSNEDAFEYSKLLTRKEGLLTGISSGAALSAAIVLAKRPENKGKTIVALLPDSGDRYYSTPLFTEA